MYWALRGRQSKEFWKTLFTKERHFASLDNYRQDNCGFIGINWVLSHCLEGDFGRDRLRLMCICNPQLNRWLSHWWENEQLKCCFKTIHFRLYILTGITKHALKQSVCVFLSLPNSLSKATDAEPLAWGAAGSAYAPQPPSLALISRPGCGCSHRVLPCLTIVH